MSTQTKNYVKIGKDAKTENADNLIREYKMKRWAPNSERIGKPDSLSAWFSIEDMENFLTLAKSNGGDGIKFYYGVFPENHTENPEYAGRQTLVPVATKSRITESGAVVNKDIYTTKNRQTKILSYWGPSILCPPNCGPSEGGIGDLGITIIDRGKKGMEVI